MSGFVVSDGKVRKISVTREKLEKIAKLLGITTLERAHGSAILTVATPRAGAKPPKAKRKSARRK